MASLVWASPSAPPGRALRMARARAWQWPRSSCWSSWRKTFRVGWRQAVSPDWTTFFTSCRDREVTALPPCAQVPSIPRRGSSRGSAHRGMAHKGVAHVGAWLVLGAWLTMGAWLFGGVAHRGQGLRVPSLGAVKTGVRRCEQPL